MDAKSKQHVVDLMLENTIVHIVVAGEQHCMGHITSIIAVIDTCKTITSNIAVIDTCKTITVKSLTNAFHPTLTLRCFSTCYENNRVH